MRAYPAAIFLGAFLLFLVQPMLGKRILPWFGGTPALWSACMLFFQCALLAGYAYAHGAARRLRPGVQAGAHLFLLGASLLFLPPEPPAWAVPTGPERPILRILAALAAAAALPLAALSSTSPLLQAWFSREPGDRAPYRLYALSNAGSLLALAAYPFLVEPLVPLGLQFKLWTAGYVAFAAASAACALRARDLSPPPPPAETAVPRRRLLFWGLLAAAPSALMLAVTNHICRDIAVVPFLWILPLALYILSFVLVFSGFYPRVPALTLLVPAYTGACAALLGGVGVPILAQVAAHSFVLFAACMACHGELHRLRPGPESLTSFYLALSAGGAVGGLAVGLLAPTFLTDFVELQLSLIACAVLVLSCLWTEEGGALAGGRPRLAWLGLLLAFGGAAGTLGYHALSDPYHTIWHGRNFYGVLRLLEYDRDDPVARAYTLVHGAITHGWQYADPDLAQEPTSYYGRGSGVAAAVESLPLVRRRIGAVGLGVGTVAAYGREGDHVRFYEINPEVARLARERFTYLTGGPAETTVVLGDARLSLEREPAQGFDLLILDAFSSDAIPTHLLTLEALRLYRRHMRPGGIIAVHVTNRHLDLAGLMFKAADELGWKAYRVVDDPTSGSGELWSDWVLLTDGHDPVVVERLAARSSEPPALDGLRAWTDDYSGLLSVLD